MGNGIYSYICMYINAVAVQRYKYRDAFYKINFKIKHKYYTAQESAARRNISDAQLLEVSYHIQYTI